MSHSLLYHPQKNDHRWQSFLGDYEKESLLGLFIVQRENLKEIIRYKIDFEFKILAQKIQDMLNIILSIKYRILVFSSCYFCELNINAR